MDITNLTIKKLQEGYIAKTCTVRSIVDQYLAVIKEKNTDINAYLEIFDDIDEQVTRAQTMIDAGDVQAMTGVPLSIKDNILIKGHVASAGSHMLENYTATYDATVIESLKEQGAIFLGRTNMDEFAMGSSTETSYFGNTKNPVNTAYVPGGSSGGPAASIAMNGALVALASDTGGSVRQPASYCGVVGLKPTYGSISRYGLMSLASSLDIIGPIAHTVEDLEVTFNALAAVDAHDSTSIPTEIRKQYSGISSEVKKIGVPRDILSLPGIDADVVENFEATLKKLEQAGYELVDIELPLMKYALPAYYIILPAEASANLARFDGVRYGLRKEGKNLIDTYVQSRSAGFSAEVQRRIILGTYVLSHGYYDAYYNKAIQLQKKLRMSFEEIFKIVDVVVTPTAPSVAFKFGDKQDNPVSMYMSDVFTVSANITGMPALSIPSGKNSEGLPYGLQVMGPYLGESKLFSFGKDFESRV